MDHLHALLTGEVAQGRLDLAAFEIARIQFPDLDPAPYLSQLNELAASLGDRLRNFNDGRDFIETAQRYLFEELGFHGNESDFFDPLNSCLNQVLERRTGIPITLSLVYMEIARRLHMPVYGVSMPRRFILQFDDGRYSTFVDPYDGARTITPAECFALCGARVADPMLLRRAHHKEIVMRMLQNLQGCYLRRSDIPRTLATLDLLIVGSPDSGRLKLRGMLNLQASHYRAAKRDLEHYLELEPEAADGAEIRNQLANIHLALSRLN